MEGNITPDAVIMYPFKEHEMVRDETSRCHQRTAPADIQFV